ncbi:MAG: hypothetical protein ACUVUF_00700 [Candidatus Bathycorpusculaceae bacterium]
MRHEMLRFTMFPKRKKKKKVRNQRLEVKLDAVKVLRNLKDEEAFYFYEDIGKPTGQVARSLSDFLDKVNSVTLESLNFHLERGDFQNWIKETLGDVKLAARINQIMPSKNEKLREQITEIVGNRLQKLKAAPVTLLVNENLVAAHPALQKKA